MAPDSAGTNVFLGNMAGSMSPRGVRGVLGPREEDTVPGATHAFEEVTSLPGLAGVDGDDHVSRRLGLRRRQLAFEPGCGFGFNGVARLAISCQQIEHNTITVLLIRGQERVANVDRPVQVQHDA